LTEQHGTWTNGPTNFTYRWLRCDAAGTNCAAIPGATSQAYTLSAADVGSTVRVEEVASNAVGRGTAATSLATPVVQSSVPWSSAPPAISGSTVQGQTLTEVHGTWNNAPTVLGYSWLRCDAAKGQCAAIAGATSQAYRLTRADVGSTIRVREAASNAYGTGSPTISAPTSAVKAAPPINVAYNTFFRYDARTRRDRATRFKFSQIPRGAGLELRCHGVGCTFKRKRVRLKGTTANLLPAVRRVRLARRSYLEVRISASGSVTEVLRFIAPAPKGTTVKRLCLPPGAKRPERC